MNIKQFVREEVIRQGWTDEPDHSQRVNYMMNAWAFAIGKAAMGQALPNPYDIKIIAYLVEPDQNLQGYRHCGVRVGKWIAPDAEDVPDLVEGWFQGLAYKKADDAYKEFELIHPFVDGNGRTGKIIHNWHLGTLQDPVLVQDFFGRGVP